MRTATYCQVELVIGLFLEPMHLGRDQQSQLPIFRCLFQDLRLAFRSVSPSYEYFFSEFRIFLPRLRPVLVQDIESHLASIDIVDDLNSVSKLPCWTFIECDRITLYHCVHSVIHH